MFTKTCLYKKPLIEKRDDFNGVPEHFQTMYSSEFWFYLSKDFIDKIVAMRVFPYQDYIAFKILPRGSKRYSHILLKEPELRILRRIWDCGHKGFNYGLKQYINHSSSCFQQWVKRTDQNHGCFDWYMDLNLGTRHE